MFLKGFFESKKHYEKRISKYKDFFDEIKQEKARNAMLCDKLIKQIEEYNRQKENSINSSNFPQ